MKRIEELKIKIFADGADRAGMLEMYGKPYIKGLTTNPTLMRKAGITDYKTFAREILAEITDKPISFEVFSDEFNEMERQAWKLQAGQTMCMSKARLPTPDRSLLTAWSGNCPAKG